MPMTASSLSLETEISLLSKVLNDVEISLKASKENALMFRDKLRGFAHTKSKLQAKLESSLNTKTTLEANIGNLSNEVQRSKDLLLRSKSAKGDIVKNVPKVKRLYELVENLEKLRKESQLKLEERKFKFDEVSYSEAKDEVEWNNQRKMLHYQNEKNEQALKQDIENTNSNWQTLLAKLERLENEAQEIIDAAATVVKALAE